MSQFSISSIMYNLKYDTTLLRLYNLILERDDDELILNEISNTEFNIVVGDDYIDIDVLDYVEHDVFDGLLLLDELQAYQILLDVINKMLNIVESSVRNLRNDLLDQEV